MAGAMPPLSIMGSLRWDVVSRMLPRGRDQQVLEVGCGQGAVGVRLAAAHQYLGVEPDADSCDTARARLVELGRGEVRCGAVDVVEPGRVFDVVVSFEVIEHIDDDEGALQDWVERVRPGGMLLISTPGYQARFSPMDTAVGHFRRYEPDALAELLRSSGLVDVEVRHYAMPIGYALEAVRAAVARRREGKDAGSSVEERTRRSGRFLQPAGQAVGLVIGLATLPFQLVQRLFPNRGPVLVATGRRPGSA